MARLTSCPYPFEFEQLLAGQLTAEQVEPLALHLEECPKCAETFASINDTLSGDLHAAVKVRDPEQARVYQLVAACQTAAGSLFPNSPTIDSFNHTGEEPPPAKPEGEDDEDDLSFLSPAQATDEIGRLDGYRILKLLGQGGMGLVFEAEDLKLKRRVAMKVMKKEVARKATHRERFLREAQSAARVEHDHIVPIFQIGEANGVPFIAMPFLKGEPLDARLKRARFDLPEIITIARQTAEGLAAAHAHGLIHRDIKPGNIWLETIAKPQAALRVKILDFGLARFAQDQAHLTQSGAIMGTPAYMAPEQARSANIDQRADLFSLGCVMYEMATGQRPFSGHDTMAILTALAIDTPAEPIKLNPELPPALSQLIMKLLEKSPDKRPADALTVADELRQLMPDNTVVVVAKPKPIVESSPWAAIDASSATNTAAPAVNLSATTVSRDAETSERSAPARRPRRSVYIGGAFFGLAALIVAIIVIIRDKDGKTIAEINVPKGGKVEIGEELPKPPDDKVSGKKDDEAHGDPPLDVALRRNPPRPGNYALRFDGKSSYVDLSTLTFDASQPLTLEAFVRIDPRDYGESVDRDPGRRILGNYRGRFTASGAEAPVGTEGIGLDLARDGQFRGLLGTSADGQRRKGSVHRLANYDWHHVAAVFDTEDRRVHYYFDGVLIGSVVNEEKATPSSKIPMRIGAAPDQTIKIDHPSCFFNGLIDEVRISKSLRYFGNFQAIPWRFETDQDTIALYHFDEGQGDVLTDHSGNRNHGKIVGAKWVNSDGSTVQSPPPGDHALHFDGKSSIVDLPPSLTIDPSQPFTVEAWVESESLGAGGVVIGNLAASKGISLEVGGEGKIVGFLRGTGAKQLAPTSPPIARLGRHHLALVFDGSILRVFVDGRSAAGSVPIGTPAQASKLPFRIGGVPDLGDAHRAFFAGLIDEIRVSKIARYTDVKKGGFTPSPRFEPDADTVALYHFDEGFGDVLKDSSGNDHHGKIVGAKWVNADGSAIRPNSIPPGDYALQFDGQTGAVDLTGVTLDLAQPFTLEAYINCAPGDRVMNIINNYSGGEGITLHVAADNKLMGRLPTNGPVAFSSRSQTSLAPGRHHVALVFDRKMLMLYVDGKSSTVSADEKRVPRPSKIPFRIGQAANLGKKLSDQFAGLMDEVRISKTARYDKPFTPAPRFDADDDTVALYHFDQGFGDKLIDSSGNGHHGKIVGGAKWVKADGTEISPPTRYALQFDGRQTLVSIPTLERATASPATLEAWVRNVGPDTEMLIRLNGPNGGAACQMFSNKRYLLAFEREGKKGEAHRPLGGGDLSSRSQWRHLAYVIDKEESLLFLDGKLLARQAGPYAEMSERKSPAGGASLGAEFPERFSFFSGEMREVRISAAPRYKQDFSPSERFAPDKDTLALYHFDEGVGEVLKDSSGNNHHGEIVGAKWVNADGTMMAKLVAEFKPRASSNFWKFEGDEYVHNSQGSADPLLLGDDEWTDYTFSFKAKLSEGQKGLSVFLRRASGGDTWSLRLGQNNKHSTYWKIGPNLFTLGGAATNATDGVLESNRWHDVSVEVEGNTMKVTLDGQLIFTRRGGKDELAQKSPSLTKGHVGVDSTSAESRWKDLLVVSSVGKVLWRGPIVKAVGTPIAPISPTVDYALAFDGKKSYAELPLTLAGERTVTLEALVSAEPPSTEVAWIVGNVSWDKKGKGSGLGVNIGKDKWLNSFAMVSGKQLAASARATDLTKPRHIAITLEPSKSGKGPPVLRLFIDGRVVSASEQAAAGDVLDGKLPLLLGAEAATKHANSLTGTIDELRISRVVRYTGPFTPPKMRFQPDKDTIALYHFDEGEGEVLKDSSGNNHHGKIIGAKWVKADGSAIDSLPSRYKNNLGMEFALAPKGKSWLGGGGGEPGDKEVKFEDDFYLGVYEVTQEEWEKVMGNNPSAFKTVGGVLRKDQQRFPVENVSWEDSQTFLARLNEQTKESGWSYRLPTSAEWEYACRGGPQENKLQSGFDYYLDKPLLELAPGQANFRHEGSLERTCRVGSYQPNALGLFDLHGNVWEWCADQAPPDPLAPQALAKRLARGGSWGDVVTTGNHRAASSFAQTPGQRDFGLGLRVARVRAGSSTNFTNALGMEFALVPKGKAWLGGGGGKPGEKDVEFKEDFYLGAYEVTQEEWEKIMGANPSGFSRMGDDKNAVKEIPEADLKRFPVERVSWNDAQEFIKRVNEQTKESGWVYRLPTGSEWEFACRGGPMSKPEEGAFHFYVDKPTNLLTPALANYFQGKNQVSLGRTCKVGSYSPNRLGLHDMHGNVSEWCDDDGTPDKKGKPRKAVSGGSWAHTARDCQVSDGAFATEPANRSPYDGLRLARVRAGVVPPVDFALEVNSAVTGYPSKPIKNDNLQAARTIEAFIKIGAGKDKHGSICGFPNGGPYLEVHDGDLRITGMGLNSFLISSKPLPVNQRLHVALVRDGKEIRIYVDGKLQGRQTMKGNSLGTKDTEFMLGYKDKGTFTGLLDEIRLSKVARYNETFIPALRFEPDADTVALYHCDEGEGGLLFDSSGNGHRIKVNSAKWVKADGSPVSSLPVRPPKFTNSLGMEFALVPKGKAWMGGMADKSGDKEVEFKDDIYFGVYEVTQEEWQKIMGVNPSDFSRDGKEKDRVKDIADADLKRFPVGNVSWNDCQEFITRLNEKTKESGWVYRLPKEEEWQYACRGGSLPKKEDYAFDYYLDRSTNTLLPDRANFNNVLKRPAKVGSYPANALGLHDMHGNMGEWCEDAVQDGKGGSSRATRGGGFTHPAEWCRAVFRVNCPQPARFGDIGVRVVRVPEADAKAPELLPMPMEKK